MSARGYLYQNGKIYFSPQQSRSKEALAVYGGRIIYAGDKESAAQAFPKGVNPTVCDLSGKAVVPGFIDSHLHLVNFGMSLLELDLKGALSIKEIQNALREAAKGRGKGEWIVGRGWDQDSLSEKRYPTRKDLDEAASGRPVYLVRNCGHVGVASTSALELSGVGKDTVSPEGGAIDKDPYGYPTGILREKAQELITEKIPKPSAAALKASVKDAVSYLFSKGVTSVHTNDAHENLEAAYSFYNEIFADGFPIRIYWDFPYEVLDTLSQGHQRSGHGDDFFRLGAAKIFADGSLGGHTAALEEPYFDDKNTRGILVLSEKGLADKVYKAHALGMQTAIHAIGDRAVRHVVWAIDAAQSRLQRSSLRHRIVHAQILSPLLMTEMRRVKAVADVQPKFLTTDMKWAKDRVGPQRIRSSYAWHSMLRAGIPLAGGSDCPVESPDPMLGIYAAVTRKDLLGQPATSYYPNERISVGEAISMFTLGGAYAAFEEGDKGTLEPGKLADFVVLSQDPYRSHPDQLKGIEVLKTVLGGEVVYEKA